MTAESIETVSAFHQVVDQLLRLQALRGEGGSESAEANAIRVAMERPWDLLTDEEMNRIDGISADLYMLTDEEVFVCVPEEQRELDWLGPRLEQARLEENHWLRLELLRHGPAFIPPAWLAFFRASSYRAVGLPQVAVLFLEHAWPLTGSPAWRCSTMLLHMELGSWRQALDHAGGILTSGRTDPRVLLSSGLVLLQAARLRRPEAPPDAATRADTAFREALKRSRADDPEAAEIRRDALMGLGLARQLVADGPPEGPDPAAERLLRAAEERVLADAA